ncbi:MAG: nucleotidyltransferase family protein [Fidelibacterota bacterium]
MVQRNALTRRDILRLLQCHQEILRQYKVRRIGLFGSFATGHQNSKSDIDFLVEFEQPTFDNFIGLVADLEKLFHRKVEVLTPDGVEGIRIKHVAENIKKSVVYA